MPNRLALKLSSLALLACTAISCTREDFGVAATHPLGDPATITGIFEEKGLTRTSRSCDLREIDGNVSQDDNEAVPGRCELYVDDARAGDKQTAKLYFDRDDKLVAVRFDFRSDERGYDKGYYKLGRFLFDYWNEIGGKDAAFGQAGARVPILGKEALHAKFETPSIRGSWIKHVFDGNLRDRVQDEVTIRRR